MVDPQPGRWLQRRGAGQTRSSGEHLFHSDAGHLGRNRRGPLGGAAIRRPQGFHVGDGAVHGRPRVGSLHAVPVRRPQLLYDLPQLLQPELPTRFSLLQHRGAGDRAGRGELRELPLQGRRRGLLPADGPGGLGGGYPTAVRFPGGGEGRCDVRPPGRARRGIHAGEASNPRVSHHPHPAVGHGHGQPRFVSPVQGEDPPRSGTGRSVPDPLSGLPEPPPLTLRIGDYLKSTMSSFTPGISLAISLMYAFVLCVPVAWGVTVVKSCPLTNTFPSLASASSSNPLVRWSRVYRIIPQAVSRAI